MWVGCYPETDIWSTDAEARGGRLVLTEDDVREADSRKIWQLFDSITVQTGRPHLIEKLPINNFRLRFLRQVFPQARFVHIVRDGREVAGSIQRAADRGGWFGANRYKWRLLAEFAGTRRQGLPIDELCRDNYERGLLEWALSVGEVERFCVDLPSRAFLEITYDGFIDRPVETINEVLSFLGLAKSAFVDTFVTDNVRRHSEKRAGPFTERELAIAGELLPKYCAQ